MSDDTTSGENTPEDNKLIRKLRGDIDKLTADIKTAGEDAVALVERGATATGLMPEGFKGFADIFATEVDGELTADSAAEWLKSRGMSTSPDGQEEEAAEKAVELEAVTNLGADIVASGNLKPQDTISKQLEEVITPGKYQSLSDVTAAVDKILNG